MINTEQDIWILIIDANVPCGGLFSQLAAYTTGCYVDENSKLGVDIFNLDLINGHLSETQKSHDKRPSSNPFKFTFDPNPSNPSKELSASTYADFLHVNTKNVALKARSEEDAFNSHAVAIFLGEKPSDEMMDIVNDRVGRFISVAKQMEYKYLAPDDTEIHFSKARLIKQNVSVRQEKAL